MKSQKHIRAQKPLISKQTKPKPRESEMTASERQLISDIQAVLTPDLLERSYLKRWTPMKPRFAGHSYYASEALYHMLGGKKAGYTPEHVWIDSESHWFISTGKVILDPTADLFTDGTMYDVCITELAAANGFLTKEPSKRAQEIAESRKCVPL